MEKNYEYQQKDTKIPKKLTSEEKKLYEKMKEISKFNPRNKE